MQTTESIIGDYIQCYNHFDVPGMVKNFDQEIVFRNIQNGKETMTLTGLPAFVAQAQQVLPLFSTRKQTLISLVHKDDTTEVEITYEATWALDFPGVAKKGDRMELKGRSIFKFREGKIISLTDIV